MKQFIQIVMQGSTAARLKRLRIMFLRLLKQAPL